MSKVVVLVSGFELGTKIADAVASVGGEAVFPSEEEQADASYYEGASLVIIDLSGERERAFKLVRAIRRNHHDLRLVGIASRIQKKELSAAREAGLDWVLPKSSLVRNLPTLLEKED